LEGRGDEREDNAAQDVSLKEAEEDADVADDGHDEGEDDHGADPVWDLEGLDVFPVLCGLIVAGSDEDMFTWDKIFVNAFSRCF